MIVLGISKYIDVKPVVEFIATRPNITHIQIRNLNSKKATKWSSDQIAKAITIFNDLGKVVWVDLRLGEVEAIPDGTGTSKYHEYDILNDSRIPDRTQQHLNIINNHLDGINRVTVSWSSCGESGAYQRWIMKRSYKNILKEGYDRSIKPTLLEFENLWKMFAPIQSKLMMTAIDVPFEREAYLYQDNLKNAPLLNWLKSHNVPNIIYRGCWLLDRTLKEHKKNYQIEPSALSPIIAHQKHYDSGTYPYKYYTDYLKAGAEFWTGIGFYRGIERGNAITLPQLGYTGTYVNYTYEQKMHPQSLEIL